MMSKLQKLLLLSLFFFENGLILTALCMDFIIYFLIRVLYCVHDINYYIINITC